MKNIRLLLLVSGIAATPTSTPSSARGSPGIRPGRPSGWLTLLTVLLMFAATCPAAPIVPQPNGNYTDTKECL
jgi:hypothetical protein